MDTDMTDVEMSSLTPPSHKVANQRPAAVVQDEELADESMANVDSIAQSSTSKITPSQHVRRKRSVLSRKGKRLAHLQSRDLVPASRSLLYGHGTQHDVGDNDGDDGSSYGTEDEKDDDEDEDEEDAASRRKSTPGRIRSITKYAVNYILPNAVSPLPHQHQGSSGSATNFMDKPELLLGYAQFIFNATILWAFLYLLYNFVRMVQKDVAEKVRSYEMDTLSEITACAAAYTANRCGTELQAPALANACKNWERCSARDPAVVGTARVTAETFAEILNGFVDSVSWKTMFFTLVCFSIVVGATNSFLSFFRIKSRSRGHDSEHSSAKAQHSHTGHTSAPPPTHAIGPPQHNVHASGVPAYYHPHQPPDYAIGSSYPYPTWQQLPPATPSRRRMR
ncbi:hypothetical protein PHSY_004120 [Pseudozyma hubeiensis SY62]|uniref:Brl1/Brr6 domain-containing protein n=1 Tax=Pseudozyma hubeiensis (strain SY62) TaxID=1305764 RepID=R9PEL1_PSEHS|nr:hypothetical protein PHSY_004120 [Pseudozyma hubeiensis SY62]GAC96540.1 hypothetical protein PHSY_004120 [Pseudozyma hubeiensis SY62]